MEGIYLYVTLTGPDIHIFDIHHKKEIVVKDFTSYPSEFPFKDPSCLTHPGYSAAEIEKMDQEDLTDEGQKKNVLRAFCLRGGLFTPRWGMEGGWGSWPPDWGGWAGSPATSRGDTSGCFWCGKRLVVVSRAMTGGL